MRQLHVIRTEQTLKKVLRRKYLAEVGSFTPAYMLKLAGGKSSGVMYNAEPSFLECDKPHTKAGPGTIMVRQ